METEPLTSSSAAPLRSSSSRPSSRPPGSTPQSHVVGVGCRRIASAIQGGQRGAVFPLQERSGAAAGSRECSGRGPAPQQQRLVQGLSEGADRRFRGDPPGTTSRSVQATPCGDERQRPSGGGGAIDAFARFRLLMAKELDVARRREYGARDGRRICVRSRKRLA